MGASIVTLWALAGLLLGGPRPVSAVELDGIRAEVRWSDGDSFEILTGSYQGSRARLMGYNTLESYGPVHQWGDWRPEQLYFQAMKAATFAAEKTWACTVAPKRDTYNRLLVRCPELIMHMVRGGHAHVYEVVEPPSAELLAAQRQAIAERKGIWQFGAPEGIITSVHSLDEAPQKATYNRIASLATGLAQKFSHANTYQACDRICAQGSCMLYVPFKRRYGDARPTCLIKGGHNPLDDH